MGSALPSDGPADTSDRRLFMHRFAYRVRARLPQWVVYGTSTRDYPGVWVTRLWVCLPEHRPTRFVMAHPELDGLRAMLPPGLFQLSRSPGDDPVIHEVWL